MTATAAAARTPRRRVRHLVAVAAAATGALNLVLAGDRARRPGALDGALLPVRWTLDAVVGSRYVVLTLGLVLIVTGRGLWRGKRNAWWIAVVSAVGTVAAQTTRPWGDGGFVAAGVLLIVLVVTRRRFTIRADPALARRGLQVIVAGELAVLAYGFVGLLLFDRDFRHAPNVGEAVEEAVRLLFLLPMATVEPVTRHGRWFVGSVRFAVVGVMMVGLTRLVAGVLAPRPAGDRRDVERILAGWSTTGLGYFHLLDDKRWLFDADREAFVGYTIVGTTAVALGEPIGEPAACRRALADFLELCDANGWTVAFHQVTGAARPLLEDAGLSLMKIGEEAIIDVRTWRPDGTAYKSMRSALRRVERAGLVVEALPTPIDAATMTELRAVSDAWLCAGGHRERTFTVGRFDPTYLRSTPVVVVRHPGADGADGAIVAFANITPTYRSADGNFDLMRRRPDAPNGVMDALFVHLIHRFRDEGRAGMNLGLAPFANITDDAPADRVLRTLYRRGEQSFHYQGLRQFKAKWQPRWEDRFLAYRAERELPKVALAVTRAGELPRPKRPFGRLRTVARTFPVSLSLAFLMVWFMAVTDGRPVMYQWLLARFGLGWSDLVRFQWWRLPTSQVMQTQQGWVWSNLLLCGIAVPVAEWRLRSARTAALFFLGDWVSTVPVLIGVRLAAAAGNPAALNVLAHRDGGPSSGAWALVLGVAMSIDAVRVRRVIVGVLLGGLTAATVLLHQLYDVQHLVSAVAVVAALAYLRRRDAARPEVTADA